jgi:hypothetical protein
MFASFYGSDVWEDVLWPPPEHYELSKKIHMCDTTLGYKLVPWEARRNLAVFRGSLTGVFADNRNPRILASHLSLQHPELLDAGITTSSARDRVWNKRVSWSDPNEIAHLRKHALTPQEQACFKYQLYIEGHCASLRLAWLLCSGSSLLIVMPGPYSLAHEQWFSKHLRPHVHFLPVQHDLSDLPTILQWLQTHDSEAKTLAQNAWEFASTHLNTDILVKHCAHLLDESIEKLISL